MFGLNLKIRKACEYCLIFTIFLFKFKSGVYIVQFNHFPPPLFEIIFFPRPKIFGVYDPKRCIFKAFFPVFLCNFRRISMRQGGAGGVGRPPAKIFEVYNPKRCIFKAFFPLFSSLFLSLFYFFSLTLQFHFFSPASHFPPPPYHSILENIYPCNFFIV